MGKGNVEDIKRESRNLRGNIATDLDNQDLSHVDDAGYQLLKFHGIYQGFNRDTATERKKQKLEKEYEFMARIRIPGGFLTAQQYLELDRLSDIYSNGTMKITTRQAIQYHSIQKQDLRACIAAIRELELTTLSACGDVVRNVTTCPAPINDNKHKLFRDLVNQLATELEPTSKAYAEIWVNGEPLPQGEDAPDPLYKTQYLPRKFKIGVGCPSDNSVDLLSNDLAVIGLFDDTGALIGYNIAIGGGFGMTHNKPETYPRLASLLCHVAPDDLMLVVKAVIAVQRDHGRRDNRKQARLKYTIDAMGLDEFRRKVNVEAGKDFADPAPMPAWDVVDHMGWHEQGDGLLYLGLPVPGGRVEDNDTGAWRTAIRDIIKTYNVDPILTANQDIIISNIKPSDKDAIQALCRQHKLALREDVTTFDRWTLACVALPTCGLALTEAERIRQPLVAAVEGELRKYKLENERISLRITGCPNGCARPYSGDIGLVGRMPGHYALYLGGDFNSTRLSQRVLDKLPEAEIAPSLGKLFKRYTAEKQGNEGFGDFCHRLGVDELQQALAA